MHLIETYLISPFELTPSGYSAIHMICIHDNNYALKAIIEKYEWRYVKMENKFDLLKELGKYTK